jgi:hypothetical protein
MTRPVQVGLLALALASTCTVANAQQVALGPLGKFSIRQRRARSVMRVWSSSSRRQLCFSATDRAGR